MEHESALLTKLHETIEEMTIMATELKQAQLQIIQLQAECAVAKASGYVITNGVNGMINKWDAPNKAHIDKDIFGPPIRRAGVYLPFELIECIWCNRTFPGNFSIAIIPANSSTTIDDATSTDPSDTIAETAAEIIAASSDIAPTTDSFAIMTFDGTVWVHEDNSFLKRLRATAYALAIELFDEYKPDYRAAANHRERLDINHNDQGPDYLKIEYNAIKTILLKNQAFFQPGPVGTNYITLLR